jgi:hypothetical protein
VIPIWVSIFRYIREFSAGGGALTSLRISTRRLNLLSTGKSILFYMEGTFSIGPVCLRFM